MKQISHVNPTESVRSNPIDGNTAVKHRQQLQIGQTAIRLIEDNSIQFSWIQLDATGANRLKYCSRIEESYALN